MAVAVGGEKSAAESFHGSAPGVRWNDPAMKRQRDIIETGRFVFCFYRQWRVRASDIVYDQKSDRQKEKNWNRGAKAVF
jgi:hypothetical protein